MGIFKDVRDDIGGLRIAMPDEMIASKRLVYKWPEKSIRKFTKAFVPEGYIAVFVNQGTVIGQLNPGFYTIDAQELPVIGAFLDRLFYDNAYRCELMFFRTADSEEVRFGGPFDRIREPDFGLPVEIRCYGVYRVRVYDGGLVIKTLVGTADNPDNSTITSFISSQIMRIMGERVVEGVLDHSIPVLGIKSQTTEIIEKVTPPLNEELARNGIQFVGFGDFNINVKDEDFERLSQLSDKVAEKRAMINLAQDPGYAAFAQGKVLEGAGEGLAQGGGAAQTAFLGLGLGVGNTIAGPFQQGMQGTPGVAGVAGAAPTQPQVACRSCGQANAAAAKFCAECGTPLGPPTVACPSCGAQNAENAKFCAECGTSMKARCASCGADLAPGAKFCPDCGTAVAPAG